MDELRERTIATIRELLEYLESEWCGLNGMIGESATVADRAYKVLEDLEAVRT